MRARLLALAAVASTALYVGVTAAGGGIASSSYHWQQPGTAPVVTSHAQPQLTYWAAAGWEYAAGSSYVWVQPGTAPPPGLAVSPH